MSLAPIVLFVYNRPWHTRKTLDALSKNILANESLLFIYSDGPKQDVNNIDIDDVKEVRKLIREEQWCKEVKIVEALNNKGLMKSVIDGVTEIVNKYGKIIVLEDDLISSPFFLQFMNKGLNVYESVTNVYSINGYMFPIKTNSFESVLLPFAFTWGWATWKKEWEIFAIEPNLNSIIFQNSFLRQRFNLADYDYTHMLMNARNSWGIHWYFAIFQRNGLGVFPEISLIQNIGFDSSGVNCVDLKVLQSMTNKPIELKKENKINLDFFDLLLNYFKDNSSKKENVFKNLKNRLFKKKNGN